MDVIGLILWLVFGAIVGWIAGAIMNDQRGLLGNIVIGIVGSFIGAYVGSLVGKVGFAEFSLMGVIFSVIGAIILIFLKQLLMGKRG